MSRFTRSLPASYFDAIYARDADPWDFASSDYERDKYAATIAALPRCEYESALEVGCSIGVLTRRLADCAAALCAIDLARQALDEARRRCSDLHHVRFECMGVPAAWPSGRFDLIVLSEVVYYLDRTDVERLAMRLHQSALPGCHMLLVHWTGPTHYPLSGDEASELLIANLLKWSVVSQQRSTAYRLDVLYLPDEPNAIDRAENEPAEAHGQ